MTLLLAVFVTRRFYYLMFTVSGCNLLFPLLDISCCWLLLNVSFTRRIHGMALLAILLNVSITRHFNYSTFQRPHRPNCVIPTIHWPPVWPKSVIAGISLISVVTQLNFNRVGQYENKRRRRLGYRGYYKGPT